VRKDFKILGITFITIVVCLVAITVLGFKLYDLSLTAEQSEVYTEPPHIKMKWFNTTDADTMDIMIWSGSNQHDFNTDTFFVR
jgi:hypothetical protein